MIAPKNMLEISPKGGAWVDSAVKSTNFKANFAEYINAPKHQDVAPVDVKQTMKQTTNQPEKAKDEVKSESKASEENSEIVAKNQEVETTEATTDIQRPDMQLLHLAIQEVEEGDIVEVSEEDAEAENVQDGLEKQEMELSDNDEHTSYVVSSSDSQDNFVTHTDEGGEDAAVKVDESHNVASIEIKNDKESDNFGPPQREVAKNPEQALVSQASALPEKQGVNKKEIIADFSEMRGGEDAADVQVLDNNDLEQGQSSKEVQTKEVQTKEVQHEDAKIAKAPTIVSDTKPAKTSNSLDAEISKDVVSVEVKKAEPVQEQELSGQNNFDNDESEGQKFDSIQHVNKEDAKIEIFSGNIASPKSSIIGNSDSKPSQSFDIASQIKSQVAENVTSASTNNDVFTIKLSPASLGDVEVQIVASREGKIDAIKLTVKDPETLRLIVDSQKELMESLKQVTDVQDAELSFNLKEGGEQGNDARHQRSMHEFFEEQASRNTMPKNMVAQVASESYNHQQHTSGMSMIL